MKNVILLLIVVIVNSSFFNCSNAEAPLTYDCTGVAPTYSAVIKPK